MKKLTTYVLLIAFSTLIIACSKKPVDPCGEVSIDNPPLKIGILLYSKATGENLVISKPIEKNDIKILEMQSGNTINNWQLVKTANSPFNGMLEIGALNDKAGQYVYKLEIKGIVSANISYTISKEEIGIPCKTLHYPMTGLKSTDHESEQFVYQNQRLPHVIKVFIL